jgi:selenocysteine-specific elongation factor
MMFLVIDIVKGVQTQTAECLIIGEICCDKLLIILNKLDLIEESKRQATVEKMSKRLLKTLESTKFANSQIVAVAANQQQQQPQQVGQAVEAVSLNEINLENLALDKTQQSTFSPSKMLNMDILLETIKNSTFFPEKRNVNGEFLFSVDHCFTIRGQGAVMTGTILNGQVKVNDVSLKY